MTEIKEESTWLSDVDVPKFEPLKKAVSADVCVVGAGLAGILTAYLLTEAGKKVVVIEKESAGSGATGYTTGFLTYSIDTDYSDLIRMIGEDSARLVLESHRSAIDFIEMIVKKEEIECEFVRISNFEYARFDKEYASLEDELPYLKKLGADVELTRDVEGFPNAGALVYKNQAKYHAVKFVAALASILSERGVQFFDKTEMTDITETDRVRAVAKHGSVDAEAIVATTYTPFEEPADFFLKKAMYLSYVHEIQLPKDSLPEGTFEDLENPYHYFRVDRMDDHDRVIVGGEDHREDVPVNQKKSYGALDSFIEKTFGTYSHEIKRKWIGGVLEPIDGLAFIGPRNNPRVYHAFGFSGNGMTYSAIAAHIISDSILGNKNEWADVYKATRIPTGTSLLFKGRDYAEELLRGAVRNTFRSDI